MLDKNLCVLNKGGTTPPQRYGCPACEVPIALVQTFGLIIVTTCLDSGMIIHVPHHSNLVFFKSTVNDSICDRAIITYG